MIRCGLLIVFLGILASTVSAQSKNFRWITTELFQIGLAETPIRTIPEVALSKRDVATAEAGERNTFFAAYLAENGNEMFQRLRNTQGVNYWYRGRLEPIGEFKKHLKDDFFWPANYHLVLVLNDGQTIAATEIIAMRRFNKHRAACTMINVFPQTALFTFGDIMTENAYGKQGTIYAGFPKTFNPSDVADINLQRTKQGGLP